MKNIGLFILLIYSNILLSQDKNQYVISSQGDFKNTSGGSLSWTLGESFISTYSNETNSLTLGFHQDLLSVKTIIDDPDLVSSIHMYPNPVKSILIVEADRMITFQLINSNGNLIKTGKVQNGTNQINFSDLSPGIYFLKVNHKKAYTIIKQ